MSDASGVSRINPGTLFQKIGGIMKYLAGVAVILTLGVPAAYAQDEIPVKMTFSGTNVATTINLRPGTITDEHQSAGRGSLGAFTFRELHADLGGAPPTPACPGPHFLVVAGAGVFRFTDGSLLLVGITEGDGCVNPAAGFALLIVKYEGASGELTMTMTQWAVLRNAANMPALLMFTGEFEGTISGLGTQQDRQDDQ
jgi:hypothetical protein